MTFPYTSDFVHHIEGSADQRWAMAEPGPEAFAIGRIGLTKSFAGFKKLVEVSFLSVSGLELILATENTSDIEQLVHGCFRKSQPGRRGGRFGRHRRGCAVP